MSFVAHGPLVCVCVCVFFFFAGGIELFLTLSFASGAGLILTFSYAGSADLTLKFSFAGDAGLKEKFEKAGFKDVIATYRLPYAMRRFRNSEVGYFLQAPGPSCSKHG